MAAILQGEVYLICMVIVGLLLYWTVKDEANAASELWFRLVLIVVLASFTAEFFFTLFAGGVIPAVRALAIARAFKTLYHIFLCVTVFTWCGYTETELKSGVFQDRATLRGLMIPLGLMAAMAIVNLWTGWLFWLDGEGNCRVGWWLHGEMLILLAATVACGVRLIGRSRYEADPARKKDLRLMAAFALCVALAWVGSALGESAPYSSVVTMILLLCLYIGTSTQQISMDKLTQVNNRQNLMGFMDYKLRNHDGALYLLMMDIDYFKTINDTYGHLEGDNALIRVAGALKRACGPYKKRPYIARYGGDEFIIIAEASRDEMEALRDGILREIDGVNRENTQYAIQLSIGAAQWQEGMDSKALIAAADSELYKKKNAR